MAIFGVETEIGIEPTARHASDLGYVPLIVEDACAAGDDAAGTRALESLRFAANSVFTDVDGFRAALGVAEGRGPADG